MSDPSGPPDWPQMIEDCHDRESKLTDWERSFIDSIEQQIARTNSMSEKQRETLDRIWDRVTA